MAIRPVCNMCRKGLDDFGALLFSPPKAGEIVDKWHICQDCYRKIEKSLVKR